MKKASTLLLLSALLLTNCSTPPTTNNPIADSWTPNSEGPWDGAIYMATSEDGLQFEGRDLILERAGVPNLLKLNDGTLVLLYQYFSNTSKELFDVIAYSTSDDNGETWTEVQAIDLAGLPEANLKPMDPTLVQLEDGRLRLYFTYHAEGSQTAGLYSATSEDSSIGSTFTVASTPALLTEENLLDPAVVYFDGLWHHYSWKMESNDNYHSTSQDGLTFTRQDDISLPMEFLGQVIPFKDGLRFYGTAEGVTTAFSNDGFTWQVDGSNLVQGADPAVQELNDGTYLMVYTSINFNTK